MIFIKGVHGKDEETDKNSSNDKFFPKSHTKGI